MQSIPESLCQYIRTQNQVSSSCRLRPDELLEVVSLPDCIPHVLEALPVVSCVTVSNFKSALKKILQEGDADPKELLDSGTLVKKVGFQNARRLDGHPWPYLNDESTFGGGLLLNRLIYLYNVKTWHSLKRGGPWSWLSHVMSMMRSDDATSAAATAEVLAAGFPSPSQGWLTVAFLFMKWDDKSLEILKSFLPIVRKHKAVTFLAIPAHERSVRAICTELGATEFPSVALLRGGRRQQLKVLQTEESEGGVPSALEAIDALVSEASTEDDVTKHRDFLEFQGLVQSEDDDFVEVLKRWDEGYNSSGSKISDAGASLKCLVEETSYGYSQREQERVAWECAPLPPDGVPEDRRSISLKKMKWQAVQPVVAEALEAAYTNGLLFDPEKPFRTVGASGRGAKGSVDDSERRGKSSKVCRPLHMLSALDAAVSRLSSPGLYDHGECQAHQHRLCQDGGIRVLGQQRLPTPGAAPEDIHRGRGQVPRDHRRRRQKQSYSYHGRRSYGRSHVRKLQSARLMDSIVSRTRARVFQFKWQHDVFNRGAGDAVGILSSACELKSGVGLGFGKSEDGDYSLGIYANGTVVYNGRRLFTVAVDPDSEVCDFKDAEPTSQDVKIAAKETPEEESKAGAAESKSPLGIAAPAGFKFSFQAPAGAAGASKASPSAPTFPAASADAKESAPAPAPAAAQQGESAPEAAKEGETEAKPASGAEAKQGGDASEKAAGPPGEAEAKSAKAEAGEEEAEAIREAFGEIQKTDEDGNTSLGAPFELEEIFDMMNDVEIHPGVCVAPCGWRSDMTVEDPVLASAEDAKADGETDLLADGLFEDDVEVAELDDDRPILLGNDSQPLTGIPEEGGTAPASFTDVYLAKGGSTKKEAAGEEGDEKAGKAQGEGKALSHLSAARLDNLMLLPRAMHPGDTLPHKSASKQREVASEQAAKMRIKMSEYNLMAPEEQKPDIGQMFRILIAEEEKMERTKEKGEGPYANVARMLNTSSDSVEAVEEQFVEVVEDYFQDVFPTGASHDGTPQPPRL
eukprot:scaffold110_cov247-Pinguiococcus_pyrenoidosus.AAC.4